jgi:hypothetical protein
VQGFQSRDGLLAGHEDIDVNDDFNTDNLGTCVGGWCFISAGDISAMIRACGGGILLRARG